MALKKYSHRRRRSPWNFPIDEVTSYQTKSKQAIRYENFTESSFNLNVLHNFITFIRLLSVGCQNWHMASWVFQPFRKRNLMKFIECDILICGYFKSGRYRHIHRMYAFLWLN